MDIIPLTNSIVEDAGVQRTVQVTVDPAGHNTGLRLSGINFVVYCPDSPVEHCLLYQPVRAGRKDQMNCAQAQLEKNFLEKICKFLFIHFHSSNAVLFLNILVADCPGNFIGGAENGLHYKKPVPLFITGVKFYFKGVGYFIKDRSVRTKLSTAPGCPFARSKRSWSMEWLYWDCSSRKDLRFNS